MAAPESAPRDFQPGDVLCGQWRLDSIIGRGGMGTVWEGVELKFGRKVAVKVLHPNLLQEEAVRRFEREAQVMAKLDHPNVVTLLAFARQAGLPFIVMRHLKGANLRAVVNENGGRLSWRQLGPLLGQLCGALDYIHARGVVHRDLKLSNVFVGQEGWLTLLDMGLARGHRSTITHTGWVWGTPHFLSPEQIAGQKQLDGRADLYGLGALTYLVLSGRYPFESTDDQELLRSHLHAPRPDITRSSPELPKAVGPVLQRAMAIAPGDRYQTANELFLALEEAFATAGATRIERVLTPSLAATAGAAEGTTQPSRAQAPVQPQQPSAPVHRRTTDPGGTSPDETIDETEGETSLRPRPIGGAIPMTTLPERRRSPPPPEPAAPVAPRAPRGRWPPHPAAAGAAVALVLAAGFVLGRCT